MSESLNCKICVTYCKVILSYICSKLRGTWTHLVSPAPNSTLILFKRVESGSAKYGAYPPGTHSNWKKQQNRKVQICDAWRIFYSAESLSTLWNQIGVKIGDQAYSAAILIWVKTFFLLFCFLEYCCPRVQGILQTMVRHLESFDYEFWAIIHSPKNGSESLGFHI